MPNGNDTANHGSILIELTEGRGSQDETAKSGANLEDDQSSHLKDAGANKRLATDITNKSTKNREAERFIQMATKAVGTVAEYPKDINNRSFKSNELRSELPMESIDSSIDIVASLKQSSIAILRNFFQVAAGFFSWPFDLPYNARYDLHWHFNAGGSERYFLRIFDIYLFVG